MPWRLSFDNTFRMKLRVIIVVIAVQDGQYWRKIGKWSYWIEISEQMILMFWVIFIVLVDLVLSVFTSVKGLKFGKMTCFLF